MRELHDHKVGPANTELKVTAMDEPGSGGANHVYTITAPDGAAMGGVAIQFQNGPIKEAGINGVTHEALLAILIDRLRGFQKGQYSTKENACALTHLQEGLHWLQQRTLDRVRRGVEGTLQA